MINKLLNYAFDNGIIVIMSREMSPNAPSFTDTKTKTIVINMNISNKSQIPFQIAHEIGHIFNGDTSESLLYFSIKRNNIRQENEAHKTAIKILAKFYLAENSYDYLNSNSFMNYFKIPYYLEEQVIKALRIN